MNKNFYLFGSLVLLLILISAKNVVQQKFYYSYDEKITLNEQGSLLIVRYDHNKEHNPNKVSLSADLKSKIIDWKDDSTIIISIPSDTKLEYLLKIKETNDVQSCNPIYTINTGLKLGVTDEFVAKFKEDVSANSIKELNNKYGVKVLKDRESYLLLQTPKGADALEISNKYQESGLTVFSHPNPSYSIKKLIRSNA
ncbi:MAG TPA: hypothetical protein VK179_21300 [Bacteroidales bacterium]|nr:hypothetical protein [Bacteroidales bacterium]